MALGERADLVARLSLGGDFAAKLKANQTALGKFQASIGRTGKGIGQVGAGLARSGAIIGTAVVGGLTAAAKVGADFEAQLNTINTIARASAEDLEGIGDGIRQIARDTGKPLEELTQGYYDLLSAGIKAADAQNVLTQANTLAIGGLASTAETVDLLTTAINVYGGDASKAAEFTDDFATAIERGKVTAAELAGSYAQVAPLAKSLNIENAELAAGYARLTASGTPAAEAATQMASAMTALLKTTPGLEKLQKAAGKNYAAIAGKQGLNVALEQMRVDADKAGIKLIDLVGRKEALLYILQTTGPNLKAYNADLAAMGTNAGTAAEQMSERQKGLAFEIGRLKANLKDAAIELAAGFLPALSRSAGKLTEFLNTGDNRKQLRAIGEDIGKTIDSIDWGGVLRGAEQFWTVLKQAGTVAKTLFDLVNLLPTEIKAAGLGLIGLNKLSGGLLGKGIGNIVGGLAGAVGGALVKAGIGRAFVQPVFVTNMGAGGLGGGVVPGTGGGLSTLAKVALVGEAIGLVVAVNAVREAVQNNATVQAQGIHQTLRDSLAGPNTANDLKTKLDGINAGIAKLEADPLAVALVTGPALDELKSMRSEVVAELQELQTGAKRNKSGSPDDRDVSPAKRTLTGSVFTSEMRKQSLDWSKLHREQTGQQSKLSGLQQAVRDQRMAMANKLDGVRAAVRAIPSPKTTVNVHTTTRVSVTANSITRTMITSGTWSAASVGAYNHAPAPI